MNRSGSIYALIDPRYAADHVQSIRYIGMTAGPLAIRLKHHASEARKGRRDYFTLRWLRSLAAKGLAPSIVEIEHVPVDQLPSREREWISAHRSIGCQLTNATDGGEGVINPSEETREKMRNRVITAETRAKLSAIKTGKTHSEHTKAKISRNRKGKNTGPVTASHRENIRRGKLGNQAWLGKYHSEESKRKCSIAKIGNTGRLGKPHSEETKRLIAASHAGDKSSSAKLTWPQVREIRAMVAAGSTQTHAAKLFGVNPSTVSEIAANKIWIDGALAQSK